MTDRMNTFSNGRYVFDVLDAGPIDGEVVVLLHGFPQTSRSWYAVCRNLHQQGYRTVAFDQRGYSPGARPRGRFAYRMSALVGDLVALITTLHAGPVHLVGHDWGAAVAWSAGAEHPELLQTLTAVSVPHPAAFLKAMWCSDQARRSYYMALFQMPWAPEFAARRTTRLDCALQQTGMTAEQIRTVHDDVVETGALTGGLNWYRAMAFTRPRSMGKVTVPTSYVWSTGDTALGRRGAELCERYVTGPYRLQVLDGSHWIPEEHPAALTEVIVDRITTPRSSVSDHPPTPGRSRS